MAKEEKKAEVITAVYKAYLHCPKCAHDIQKPLLRIPGVHSVDAKSEKGEITVKGAIDAKKIHARIQKWSKKNVELISETKSKVDVIKKVAEGKSGDKVVEFKEVKKVEVKTKEGEAPYFIHYVYAPQLFSDENPNACSIL
ncbi:hypothetical protein DH2020_023426 [Rehmannia glutinosa]|uniref:HMA domain-containing protein n=1 Tax=Rehmannia glutinosa TaxID=99300 RepID=A0ABR0W610_REHGL